MLVSERNRRSDLDSGKDGVPLLEIWNENIDPLHWCKRWYNWGLLFFFFSYNKFSIRDKENMHRIGCSSSSSAQFCKLI